MKRWMILLALCLAVGLCACAAPEPTETDAPATTAEPAPILEAAGALELDGDGSLPLYIRGEALYVEAEKLCAQWGLGCEAKDETLDITQEGRSWSLRHQSYTANTSNGRAVSLGAPVLRGASGWYLPVSALERLWDRRLVQDGEDAALLRCLRVEAGPTLACNEIPAGDCLLCNGTPVLAAEDLAALSGGTAESGQSPDGTPALTLAAWGRTLTLREGSLTADLDGQALALPVPAWREGDRWYLPAAAAEALGCTVLPDENRIDLYKALEGSLCWFAGTGLGPGAQVGEALCARLSVLTEALGGTLTAQGDGLTLEALGRRLSFRPGAAEAEADGAGLDLGQRAISDGDDWLIPLAPVAEALGLKVRVTEDGGLVCSRMEPCDGPLLWVNGRQVPVYTLPEGGLYVRLNDAAAAAEGSLETGANEATLTGWGRTLRLRGGETEVLTETASLELSAPAVADGDDWYAPAAELLPALGLTELIDPELDQRYYTHIVRHDAIPTGYPVPVLMYHAVSDNLWGISELFVSPARLEEQLKALVEGGYTAITFEDLDRIDEIEKPVLLTFDDGYDDNYTELFPLLKKYNVKATIFMIVNDIGKNHKLTLEQLQEMSDSGLVSIQSHTMSHGYLDEMGESRLHAEHYDSMLALARITGKQPFVLCYPSGRNAGYTREITAQYYEFGLNMGGPCYVTGDAPYRIYRYYISRYIDLETFLRDIQGK